ncbi:MAG: YhjD/YihY/BrkB family envelope integrity protein [Planctomycetota bacterium]|jgi:membrane protein
MLKLTELLSTPTAQLGRASRFIVFQIKLWSHCARLLRINRAGQQAAALSYRTIFGIIPLAIVMLLIFRLFPAYSGIGQEVKSRIYEEIHLSTIEYSINGKTEETIMLTEYLDQIVADFFTGVNAGSVTLVSLLIVIWAALALLSTIERAFNNIWHVAKGRNFLHRIINYWALLTLGPILLGVGVYVTTQNSAFVRLEETESGIAPVLLSYLVSVVAFFLLYFVLPNTKVKAKAAIWGAAVAALVWAVAKWGFGAYVTKFIPYSQVYGVLGLIPLGVFWIYVSWLIVLFGLQLTFTTQHLKSLDAAEIAAAKKTEEYFIANNFTIINIVREIAVAFQANQAPVSPEVICSKLDIPAEFGQKILEHLVNSNLIARTSEPTVGFLPARDLVNIKLSDIAEAVAAASIAQSTTDSSASLQQIARSQQNALAQYSLKQILNVEQNS